MSADLIYLNKSKEFAAGVEYGYLAAMLYQIRPPKFTSRFMIENQERVFMAIQRAGYSIGEWRESPDGNFFTVDVVAPSRRSRGRVGR